MSAGPSLLALPISAAEVDDKTIIWEHPDLNGGNPVTLVLSPDPGDVWYNVTQTADDLAAYITAQMTAREAVVDPTNARTWNYSYGDSLLPTRLRLCRAPQSPPPSLESDWSIDWNTSTFNGTLLGLADSGATTSKFADGDGNMCHDAPDAAARVWCARRRTWRGAEPRRLVIASEALSGKREVRVIGAIKRDVDLVYSRVPYASIFASGANDEDLAAAVLGLGDNDPHWPLEHLWSLLQDLHPIRYTPSFGDLTTYSELQVRAGDTDWLEELRAVVTSEHVNGSYLDISIPLMEVPA